MAVGCLLIICLTASSPSITGIFISIVITLNCSAVALSTASCPFLATVISKSKVEIISLSCFRTKAESSTIKTFLAINYSYLLNILFISIERTKRFPSSKCNIFVKSSSPSSLISFSSIFNISLTLSTTKPILLPSTLHTIILES